MTTARTPFWTARCHPTCSPQHLCPTLKMPPELIDPNGDLIIVCNEVSFRVDSKALGRGSPVFKAMLNPESDFKEGRALRDAHPGSPAEIELPEDDADAFRVFANLAHLRFGDVPDEPNFEALDDLAWFTDKYQCSELIKHLGHDWMNYDLRGRTSKELWLLLNLAYAADSEDGVDRISHLLVKQRTDRIWRTAYARENGSVLPAKVFDQFEAFHGSVFRSIQDVLLGPVNREQPCLTCKMLLEGAHYYIDDIAKKGLLPGTRGFATLTVPEIYQRVTELGSRAFRDHPLHSHCSGGSGFRSKADLLQALLRCTEDEVDLCLDCLKDRRCEEHVGQPA
ncbi:hypothetical protein BDV18DRAFT_134158 [Aspergillus unguis]